MTPPTQEALRRLQAANPAPIEVDRWRGAAARATLERILSERETAARRPRLPVRLPRGVGVVVAIVVAGGGAAVAATNPFGWWSANSSSARFAVNPAVHVRTPTVFAIRCHTGSAGTLTCAPHGSGQLYTKIDTIHLPAPTDFFTRSHFLQAVAHAQATHRLSNGQATKFRHDLAQVPDSFFTELRLAARYQTYGGGDSRVPPRGVPEFLVCEEAGSTLSCQDLNGDKPPLGAGVYSAAPAPDWRPAPRQRRDTNLPPGIHFTAAEYRLLIDLARGVGSSSTASRVSPQRAG